MGPSHVMACWHHGARRLKPIVKSPTQIIRFAISHGHDGQMEIGNYLINTIFIVYDVQLSAIGNKREDASGLRQTST